MMVFFFFYFCFGLLLFIFAFSNSQLILSYQEPGPHQSFPLFLTSLFLLFSSVVVVIVAKDKEKEIIHLHQILIVFGQFVVDKKKKET
jgi:uncharacterized membrane protein